MSTTHWSVPPQAPLHPENVDAALGMANSETAELLGYAMPHTPVTAPPVMEHDSGGDASGAVTVPEPVPLPCTRSTWLVSVGVWLTVSLSQLAEPAITHTDAVRAHRRN